MRGLPIRVAALMVTLLLVACSYRSHPAHESGDARQDERASVAFCEAAERLAVGTEMPTTQGRLEILRAMRHSSPQRWKDVLQAGIDSVVARTDMSRRWDGDLVALTRWVEAQCDLNMPDFEPRRDTSPD